MSLDPIKRKRLSSRNKSAARSKKSGSTRATKKPSAPKQDSPKSAPKAKPAVAAKSGIDLRGERILLSPEANSPIRPMQLVTDHETVGSATMLMRWSVDPKVIESLEKSGVLDSALVLINVAEAEIIDCTIEKDRPFRKFRRPQVIVARLTDFVAYVQFKAPGRHIVVATIIIAGKHQLGGLDQHAVGNAIKFLLEERTDVMSDYAPEDDISLKTVFNPLRFGRLTTRLVFAIGQFAIRTDGSGVSWNDYNSMYNNMTDFSHQAAFLSVDVDPGLFAGKPWDWKWLNWRRENRPIDQCHARRRRLYAYTLQPIIWLVITAFHLFAYTAQIVLNICVVLVIKWGFLSRSRIEWRSVFNLAGQVSDTGFIDRNGNEVKDPIDRSIFITDRQGYSRSKWVSFFVPVYCIPTLATFVVANTFAQMTPFLYWVLTVIGGLLLLITLIDPLVEELMREWRAFRRHVNSTSDKYNQPIKPIEPVQPASLVVDPLIRQALTRELSPADVRLSALPRPVQTFSLRFTDFKRVVCKPFAG